MKFSIIIPTINRKEDLINTCLDISRQVFNDIEVIIVDQSEVAIRKEEIAQSLNVKIIHSNVKSASHARNIGILNSCGEILLFLDDDVIIHNINFLDEHLKYYDTKKQFAGVIGAILEKNNPVFKHERSRLSYLKNSGWLFFPRNYAFECNIQSGGAGNMSIRRDKCIQIGGMNEMFEKGANREEADFCWRAVKKFGNFIYSPSAYLIHIGNPTGGIRSWNKETIEIGQHNFNGTFYYMFNLLPFYQWPLHIIYTIKYFFFDTGATKNAKSFFRTLKKTLIGIYYGLKMTSKKSILLSKKK